LPIAVVCHHQYSGRSAADVRFWLLVLSIPWTLIGWVWVWVYNIAWMFMLGSVRFITERFATYRTARQIKTAHVVN
jgi:H+-transporting ATPase